jgi:hypothetical protein
MKQISKNNNLSSKTNKQRLLDVGFEAELEQLIEYCPKKRQSMLFSATMTDKVDKLIKLSLKNPVRVQCNPKTQVRLTCFLNRNLIYIRFPLH